MTLGRPYFRSQPCLGAGNIHSLLAREGSHFREGPPSDEYWMYGRQLEVDLLKDIKGLPGGCQMVSDEEERGETKYFRGNVEAFPPERFHNRIVIRIILEVHGKTIDPFKSAEELLGALRDAIDGESFQNNIISRVDSFGNTPLVEESPTKAKRHRRQTPGGYIAIGPSFLWHSAYSTGQSAPTALDQE
ncbi:hypothetical protein EST38_g8804 [Candolleomyces aberdarensis]|uniref:Fungal-type protein kinase domain-containing protein n=1 Tax=Candolleomyces aberdarensis TaxID=2316362 RepID=A0A4V1Q320_9AGAR|nr:hypothetical protein EST38_g8804 [Candolleomyces aberdarensis]